MKFFYTKGISAIETIIIISVIVMLVVIAIPQFAKIRENQVLKNAVGDVSSSFNKAKTQTLASVNSYSYGVHIESSQVIIFRGTSYVAGDSDNEVVNITSPANISNVTLGGVSGSSGDVYFSRLSGVPNTSGTITISTSSYSKTLTISATGIISSN